MDNHLLNAFQVIAQAPLEDLLAHRRDAAHTFDKLRMALSASEVPGTISPVDRYYKPTNDSVSALVRTLNREQDNIMDHLSLSEVDAAVEIPCPEKRHNLDLASAIPVHTSSKSKFQTGLEYRHLALEYDKWELKKFRMSKINDLHKDQTLVFANGHIASFVKEQSTCTNKEISKKAVRHGIKMLVFGRLCQTSAVSAVLSFAYTRFRSVKFTDLSHLKVILNGSPWIAEIMIQKERWYHRCQEYFNGKSTHFDRLPRWPFCCVWRYVP